MRCYRSVFPHVWPLTSAITDEIGVWLKDKVIHVHAKKVCGGVEVYFHSFLISALDGVRGQIHGRASSLTGKAPPLPGGPQTRPGLCREQKNLFLQIDRHETLRNGTVVFKSLPTFDEAYRRIGVQQFE